MIDSFQGPYRCFSNFYASPVEMWGEVYPTVEHAYQAAKSEDPFEIAAIRGAPMAADAKALGRKVVLRPFWEEMKIQVMESLLRQKFAPGTEFGEKLIATGDVELIEGNTWSDRFWGCGRDEPDGPWIGENHLGRLLMKIRADLQAEGMTA